jgi:hypothetical protein
MKTMKKLNVMGHIFPQLQLQVANGSLSIIFYFPSYLRGLLRPFFSRLLSSRRFVPTALHPATHPTELHPRAMSETLAHGSGDRARVVARPRRATHCLA